MILTARLTCIVGLMLAVALIFSIIMARAGTGPGDDRQCPAGDVACKCAEETLQDGEAAETPQQKADYDRCMQRASKPVAFKPWQRIWQCSDIRVTESGIRPGVINYDLAGTIWGGSQFTYDLNREKIYFNGRACLPVR